MRRQTLALVPVLAVALVMSAAAWWQTASRIAASTAPAAWRRVAAAGLELELPADARGPELKPGDPWTATEFASETLGAIRIARELPRSELQAALRDWFQLPGPLDRALNYRMRRQPAQARPVTVFGPAGLFAQRQGRMLVLVCVFDLDGRRYWLQTRTPGGGRATLASFGRMLGSLRGPGGVQPDAALAAELAAAAAGFLPEPLDPRWAAALPAGFLLVMAVLLTVQRRLSGRPGKGPEWDRARLAQPGVEVALGGTLQQRYFDAALAVSDDGLMLYTFGTPLLHLPLAMIQGRISEGAGWFGPPYLELALEGPLDYRKRRFLYSLWRGRTRLRIYTGDCLRLRAALGA